MPLDLSAVDLTTEVVRTERLVLRPYRPDDVDAVFRACQDPLIQRWITALPLPYTEGVAREWACEQAPRQRAEGCGMPTVVEADGELVGLERGAPDPRPALDRRSATGSPRRHAATATRQRPPEGSRSGPCGWARRGSTSTPTSATRPRRRRRAGRASRRRAWCGPASSTGTAAVGTPCCSAGFATDQAGSGNAPASPDPPAQAVDAAMPAPRPAAACACPSWATSVRRMRP